VPGYTLCRPCGTGSLGFPVGWFCPEHPSLKSETWATHSKSGRCSFVFDYSATSLT
jgi:hypothetical protein